MSVSPLRTQVVAVEQRRRLYTTVLVLLTVAVLAAGFTQAEQMNSGGFVQGLVKFFDYPGEIVSETWSNGIHSLSLLLSLIHI